MIAALISNIMRKEDAPAFTPADFMPADMKPDDDESEYSDPGESLWQNLRRLAEVQNDG